VGAGRLPVCCTAAYRQHTLGAGGSGGAASLLATTNAQPPTGNVQAPRPRRGHPLHRRRPPSCPSPAPPFPLPQVRDLEGAFTNGLAASAPSFLERYGAASDSPELEALPEEVQLLLGDKDALLNAVQARLSRGPALPGGPRR
jgi:hypothetical protein